MKIILFTVFVDVLGLGILIPVIPILLADPASPHYLLPAGWTLDRGYITLGFLLAVFPFMQFLSAPILGQLSDKYGRKRLLALCLAGTSGGYALFALAIIIKSIPLLFIARAIDGITGGNIAIAQAAIADISKPSDRVKNFGLMGATFGVGFIVGPFLGGVLSDSSIMPWFSAATPFWFATALAFLNTVFVSYFFPETNREIKRHLQINWRQSLQHIAAAATHARLRVVFLSNFFFQGGFTFFTTFFSVFLFSRFGVTQSQIGTYFAVIGVCIALGQALVVRRLSGKFQPASILRVTLILVGLYLPLHFLPAAWWQMFFLAPLFAVLVSLTQSNMTGQVSLSAAGSVQGEVLGINASVQALAQSVPPVLTGFIAASLSPSAPIVVAAITILLAGLIFIVGFTKPREPVKT